MLSKQIKVYYDVIVDWKCSLQLFNAGDVFILSKQEEINTLYFQALTYLMSDDQFAAISQVVLGAIHLGYPSNDIIPQIIHVSVCIILMKSEK